MGIWLWLIVFVAVLVVVAAFWAEGSRGSRDEYRGADLPPTKRGRPRPVDFDHTVGPCGYDVDRVGPTGTSARR